MNRDPAIDFWLHFLAREGALVQGGEDRTLVVLPSHLQSLLQLSEETWFTSDPQVAQESKAMLLVAGHPVLERAAQRVLQASDVGYRALAWPQRRAPTAEELLAHARQSVTIEHGRLDLDGVAAPILLPLLHCVTLVTYRADLAFQEREEVWIFGHNGQSASASVVEIAADSDEVQSDSEIARHRCLGPHWALALQAVGEALEARTARRAAELSRQQQAVQREEVGRTETYYQAVLDSIAERQTTAGGERQLLYLSQAETTRLERNRRLKEIEEKYSFTAELRPFRLHVVLLPAWSLPVAVRRGDHCYPWWLAWLPQLGAFAPWGCPHCLASEALVVGRERLGCRRCLPRSRPQAHPGPPAELEQAQTRQEGGRMPVSRESADEVLLSGGPEPAKRKDAPQRPTEQAERHRAAAGQQQHARTMDDALQGTDRLLRLREDVDRVGEAMIADFWSRVVERRPWRRVPRQSPLSTLYDLYGPGSPMMLLGLRPGTDWDRIAGRSNALTLRGDAVSVGLLRVDQEPQAFRLHWRLTDGRAVVYEVLPDINLRKPELLDATIPVLKHPPQLHRRLDPVASLLWTDEIPRFGLPLVLRSLSAWSRLDPQTWLERAPAEVLATALMDLVRRHSGLRRSREAMAAERGVGLMPLTRIERELQQLLQMNVYHPW